MRPTSVMIQSRLVSKGGCKRLARRATRSVVIKCTRLYAKPSLKPSFFNVLNHEFSRIVCSNCKLTTVVSIIKNGNSDWNVANVVHFEKLGSSNIFVYNCPTKYSISRLQRARESLPIKRYGWALNTVWQLSTCLQKHNKFLLVMLLKIASTFKT